MEYQNLRILIPVRCFTCGKVIANKLGRYIALLKSGVPENEAFDRLGLYKICCRRMIISHPHTTF